MTARTNNLIKAFGDEKRWINWVLTEKDGKMTKVPLGSSTDPETWSTYKDLKKGNFGIVFTPEMTLLGIDIDHCLKDGKIDHNHPNAEQIEILLQIADTYVEISPSGDGLHLFLKVTEPLALIANKKAPFECYTVGRFFTVTTNVFEDYDKPVRIVNKAEALSVLSAMGYPWGKDKVQDMIKESKVEILTDEQVLEKMLGAKNGDKIKRLYEGDVTMLNGDLSSIDMALVSNFAFWTGGNMEQMERLWLASPAGAREKTQNRADYRKRTIENVLASTKEFYKPPKKRTSVKTYPMEDIANKTIAAEVISEVVKEQSEEVDYDFLFTEKGKERIKVFTMNTENICRILRKHPRYRGGLRYDRFKNEMEIKDKGKWRPFEEADTLKIMTQISIEFEFFQKVSKLMVYDAITKVAFENEMDSAVDYVKSVKWDGVKRLDNWLYEVYGAPKDAYHIAVATNWMKGLVSRILYPGCKFDHVLVLEGEQGTRKSTSLAVLGGSWHVETTMGTESKDFFMQFNGKAIVEFSEGETLSRTEVKRMKAIITTQFDKYRPPYERVSKDFPRRCVFAMTTNQTEYLKDETGNRRWLPVKLEIPHANVEWLEENRDQLFAETYHRIVELKETSYEFPWEETKKVQDARKIQDPNSERIAEWYFTQSYDKQFVEGITVHEVYAGVFNQNFGSNKPITKYEEMSIANVLKDVLKLEPRRVVRRNIRSMRWFNPNKDEKMMTTTSSIEDLWNSIPSENEADDIKVPKEDY